MYETTPKQHLYLSLSNIEMKKGVAYEKACI